MNKKWQIFEPDKNKIEEIKNKYNGYGYCSK